MKTLLYLTSSAQGQNSNSSRLADGILEKLLIAHPGIRPFTRDLGKHPLPYLDEDAVSAFFTPAEFRTPEQKELLKNSDNVIGELLAADVILIGVAMYNFGIPSTLKSWVDHVTRPGLTFNYSPTGPIGLVKNKKVYLAISTGAIYSEGPLKDLDFTERYLYAMLNFLGITDIITFRVEGTGIPDLKDLAIAKATEQVAHFDFEA